MRRTLLPIIVVALAGGALLQPESGNAMSFRQETPPSGMLVLHFEGKIEHGDYAKAINFHQRMSKRYPGKETVVSLNSRGGFVAEATKIAAYLHEQHQNVTVFSKNQCVSACFMLFAAGKQRFVARGQTWCP